MTLIMPTAVYLIGIAVFLVFNIYLAVKFIKNTWSEEYDNFADFATSVFILAFSVFLAFIWPYEVVILILVGLTYLAWKVYQRVRRNV